MKKLLIALLLCGPTKAFAETIKVGIYSQVGTITEFCSVTQGYVFVNGYRTAANENLGKIFQLQVPENAKLVIKKFSPGYKVVS